jgi:hypothetical protein
VNLGGPGWDCLVVGGRSACQRPCSVDGDCPVNQGCTGVADDGDTTCEGQSAPCTLDQDCNGFGSCHLETGLCLCADDGDCTNAFSFDHCYIP